MASDTRKYTRTEDMLLALAAGISPPVTRPGGPRRSRRALVQALEERDALPRYYLPSRENIASGLPRLPAAELEAAVLEQLRGILRAPGMLAEVVTKAVELDPALDEAQVTVAMTRLDQIWEQLFPTEQQRIVNLMIERVDLVPGGLKIKWRAIGWKALIGEFAPETLGAELAELEESA